MTTPSPSTCMTSATVYSSPFFWVVLVFLILLLIGALVGSYQRDRDLRPKRERLMDDIEQQFDIAKGKYKSLELESSNFLILEMLTKLMTENKRYGRVG